MACGPDSARLLWRCQVPGQGRSKIAEGVALTTLCTQAAGADPGQETSSATFRLYLQSFLITISELETTLGVSVPQGAGGLLLMLTRESPLTATNGVT